MDREERIRAIADRFLDRAGVASLSRFESPFDVAKPNLHDNKPDFLAEQTTVLTAISQAEGLLDLLIASHRDGAVSSEVGERLNTFVDLQARKASRNFSVVTAYELVRRNAAEVGLTSSLAMQLIDLKTTLEARKQELSDQESEFWSGKSRPPNHYARTIALRFARLVARKTNAKPTFGTSRDGSHPSTEFGRALEEIYEVLEIRSNVKNAAVWAISQLTDEDCQRSNWDLMVEHYAASLAAEAQDGSPNAALTNIEKMLIKP